MYVVYYTASFVAARSLQVVKGWEATFVYVVSLFYSPMCDLPCTHNHVCIAAHGEDCWWCTAAIFGLLVMLILLGHQQ